MYGTVYNTGNTIVCNIFVERSAWGSRITHKYIRNFEADDLTADGKWKALFFHLKVILHEQYLTNTRETNRVRVDTANLYRAKHFLLWNIDGAIPYLIFNIVKYDVLLCLSTIYTICDSVRCVVVTIVIVAFLYHSFALTEIENSYSCRLAIAVKCVPLKLQYGWPQKIDCWWMPWTFKVFGWVKKKREIQQWQYALRAPIVPSVEKNKISIRYYTINAMQAYFCFTSSMEFVLFVRYSQSNIERNTSMYLTHGICMYRQNSITELYICYISFVYRTLWLIVFLQKKYYVPCV